MDEARAKLDALLQRAGINDQPDYFARAPSDASAHLRLAADYE
jgi:hypothetical protein